MNLMISFKFIFYDNIIHQIALKMQRRQTVKTQLINSQAKRKKSPSKSLSPLKLKKKGKNKLVLVNKNGSKRSIRLKQSISNSLLTSLDYLPLNNFQIKQRLLDRVAKKKDKKHTNNTSNDQSAKSYARYLQPNGEYFGTNHSINAHLQHSKNSKISKNSKNSKSSSKSKSSSVIANKMKEYRDLQAKQLSQIQAITGANPKEIKRLQKIHSLERIQAIQQLVGVQRYM